MRRLFVPLVVFGLSVLTSLAVSAQSGGGDPSTGFGPVFTGTWQFVSQSPGQAAAPGLVTFAADGTVIASGLPVQAAGPAVVFISPAQGVWQAAGADNAMATVILLVADAQGHPRGSETDHLRLTLAPGGQTFQGKFTATVSDPTGKVENTLNGTLNGTRVAIAPAGLPRFATPAP